MNFWILQHFLNPALVAGGAALIASPIIIHLINRMRYRRVRFAAMEFLLQSQKRNRRRLLIEQLLLLLLRVLIVLGLLALIARMVLNPNELSIFRGAMTQHYVLIDDSGSMRDRWGETTAFDQAKDVVLQLVSEGAQRPGTQKLTLLALSNPDQPLLVERDVNEELLSELKTKLENLQCTYRSLDLVAGMDSASRMLEGERAAIRNLHVVSDFRTADWLNQPAMVTNIKALDAAGITVNLVKTVPEQHANLAITELSGDLQVAAAGVPVQLRVGVKNYSQQRVENVRVSVLQNGVRLPFNILFEKIEAGEEVVHEKSLTFDRPGRHKVQVGIEGDALEGDNSRFLAVEVAPANQVLIVDGDPAGESGLFVADALAADPSLTGFATLIETSDFLRKQPLDRFQCIYMINVPDLTPDGLDALQKYVEAGGGLVWFTGNTIRPSYYNEHLYAGGTGLFPVPLARASAGLPPRDDTTPGADLSVAKHPVFRIFEEEENSFLNAVNIYDYYPVEAAWERDDNKRKDGVATIASLRNRDPLVFEHRYGKGRIVTCLTSVDTSWNNWPRNPSYVVFQLELEKYLAKNERGLERRMVGEPIDFSLDPAKYTETIEIVSPGADASGVQVTRLQAAAPVSATPPNTPEPGTSTTQDAPQTPRLIATYRQTDAPGVYIVKLLDQSRTPEEQWYAYNVPLEESNLELAATVDLKKRLGEDVKVSIQEAGSLEWLRGEEAGSEIRRMLLILLVVFLLCEQLLAFRLSYHPTRAGATA